MRTQADTITYKNFKEFVKKKFPSKVRNTNFPWCSSVSQAGEKVKALAEEVTADALPTNI